jgi:hypothetical protein
LRRGKLVCLSRKMETPGSAEGDAKALGKAEVKTIEARSAE